MEVWMKGKQMGVVHLDAMVLLNRPVPSKSDLLAYSARTSFYCARSCVGGTFYGFLEVTVGSKSRPWTWFICPNNGEE
jgi:hypothetical protein